MPDLLKNGTDASFPVNRFAQNSRILSRVFAFISIIFPLLSAIGWIFGIPILTRGFPSLPAMVPNTAACLILAAVSGSILGVANGVHKY